NNFLSEDKASPLFSAFSDQQLPITEVASAEIGKQMVMAGLGRGLVRQSAVHRELAQGHLHTAAHQGFPRQTLLSVITCPAERLSKSIWSFLAHAVSEKSH
ncbi:LysR substrate-binding domain-containing protein, partial [Frankia sp. Cpl3]|nr:LysR substrate-binding domain-containing protein [Frankia sp. Cpl3]